MVYAGTMAPNALYEGDAVNNGTNRLVEDGHGNIWYCNRTGIYKWDAYTQKIAKARAIQANEFASREFNCIIWDRNQTLWLVNILEGVFAFDIASGQLKPYPLPARPDHTDILLSGSVTDAGGSPGIALFNGGRPYLFFNTLTHTYSFPQTNLAAHALFFGRGKEVYSFNDSLVFRNAVTNNFTSINKQLDGKKINFYSAAAAWDNYGRLWMTARNKGLYSYEEKTGIFHEYRHNNARLQSLPFDLTTCLYIDRGQNLWIGMDGGGVARLDLKPPLFNLFPLSEDDYPVLKDYFTKCFYEDEQERIWFGSHTNGLNILDPKTGILSNYQNEKDNPHSLPGNIVGSIVKDRQGNIWVGSSGGISLFDERRRAFKTIPIANLPALHPQVNSFVYKIIQLKNNDLLAATILGLVKITRQKNGSYEGWYFNDKPFLQSATTDVVEMPGDVIYATVPEFGLYELKAGVAGYSLQSKSLPGIDLRSVRPDDKNPQWLWVSTAIGLIHFNTATKKYVLWNSKNGMASSYVYGTLEDTTNGLWLSTNGGLSFFNTATQKFDNYTNQDGLQSNEFNTQAFYKSGVGNFYFGGIKGFNWFRPGSVKQEPARPQAAITQIAIRDHVYEPDSVFFRNRLITAEYDSNDVDFQLAVLDYTRPGANKVQYTLEGWDKSWTTTFTKSVRYSHLSPGHYVFRVRASNTMGSWGDEEQIFLVIKAPFWQSAWFRTMVILLLLVATIFTTRRLSLARAKQKLRLLEKQVAIDKERRRISADMHDEIGNGITHIALLSELIRKKEMDSYGLKIEMAGIATSARKLVQTMSEIIWALAPQNDTLENLLAYTREQSRQYFDGMEIELVIDFPDKVPELVLDNEERRNLFLVTKEALANALKHARAEHVCLSLTISGNQYCFQVKDDGVGMPDKKINIGSNGLRNMKKRMEDIGGKITWTQDAKGITVSYSIIR